MRLGMYMRNLALPAWHKNRGPISGSAFSQKVLLNLADASGTKPALVRCFSKELDMVGFDTSKESSIHETPTASLERMSA